MKLEINTLYWDNTPDSQIQAHKDVTEHFSLNVNYYPENSPHGRWMDRVCSSSQSDVIGFLDSDCVPLSIEAVLEAVKYVRANDSFLGVAQASNHIHPKSHVYAAPAFFFITKSCWQRLETSFSETHRSDVGEELTYKAETIGKRYRCLYPSTFEREPVEGVWPLGNFGYYGVGTVFGEHCYHLYQGRMGNNVELFVNRCQEIIDGTFDNRFHTNSQTFNYKGRIVP
jgi:hypothetical protein